MAKFALTSAWTKVAAAGSTVEVQAVGAFEAVLTPSSTVPAGGADGTLLYMGTRTYSNLPADLYARASGNYTGTLEVVAVGAASTNNVTATKSLAGGLSQYAFRVVTSASANAALIKAGAATLYGYCFANTSSGWRYVHLYDSATVPTMGTTPDARIIALPPNSSVAYGATDIGVAFLSGLSIAVTTAAAALDNTVATVAAGDVVGMLDYA